MRGIRKKSRRRRAKTEQRRSVTHCQDGENNFLVAKIWCRKPEVITMEKEKWEVNNKQEKE